MKNNGPQRRPALSSRHSILDRVEVVRYALRFIVFCFFLLLPPPGLAQDASIKAGVNKTNFSTDELVILSVTVVDDSPQQPRPLLPRLDGLAVIDLDLTTTVTNVNGTLYTEVLFTYKLQPRRTGALTIPPIAVEIDGQRLETQSISINVTQGQAPLPAAGNEVNPDDITPPSNLRDQDFFIESQVDIKQPYIHQQIIHTFRFYQAIRLYKEPQYDEPLFTGFERVGLPVRQYNLDIDKRTYLITEIRTMLFPKNVGSIPIRPARLVLLGNFYEEPVEMYTEPLTVEVQPLPDNAPAGFKGAVGQYEIKAWFSPKTAVVNQPATYYVAVSGLGNMNLLPEPVWPQADWWRAYDTLTSLTTDIEEDELLTGTRVFERLVVPGQVGRHTLSPASFVYFDPVAGAYRTITTEPIPVEVIPAPTPAPTTPAPAAPPPTPTPAGIAANPPPANGPDPVPEIQPVLVDAEKEGAAFLQPPLFTLTLLGLCGLLPLATAAGAGGLWVWQQRRQKRLPPEERTAPRPDDALQPLPQNIHPVLAAAMQGSQDNYKTAGRALTGYLADLLGKPVTGMTRSELSRQLRRHGLAEALVARVDDCLTQCEVGRYGPEKEAGWSLMATVDELLAALDEATNVSRR